MVCYRYNIKRGYGYIVVDDGGPDIFVHATGLETSRPLKLGNRVRFATAIDRQTCKPKAIHVKLVSKSLPMPCKAKIKTSAVYSNPCALEKNDDEKVKALSNDVIHLLSIAFCSSI